MKLSKLLATRKSIIRQANLANLAYAYLTLKRLADRTANAQLTGLVHLRQSPEEEPTDWATLTALEGNQSVIEEHFDDDDIMDLADAIAFALESPPLDIKFRL